MSGEKTEKPSEQRKRKSRETGDGVKSRELTAAAAMLCGLLLLRGASVQFLKAWSGAYESALAHGTHVFDTPDGIARFLSTLLLPAMGPVAAVMAAALAGAIAVGAMQTGGVQVHPGALALKPGRLSPANNTKNMFSMRSVLRLSKSLVPTAIVVILTSHALRGAILPMPVTSYARLPITLTATYGLSMKAAWISLAWSAIDYLNEWRSWNNGLKMSKEDVRREMKESNGNPHTKGRIRQIQRAMRKRRVRADVAKAAVVITNPTHYAVALLFDLTTMSAPKVLAKGRDLHALDIREQARWAGVPIVENPPLARSLYRSVEEGQAIPFELYSAVAAILAFLFREASDRSGRDARNQTQHRGYGYAAQPRVQIPVTNYDPATSEGGRL
ncbi:flagellar biosynthesis pathway, component FlhB [Terriglobus roseus DSM 18391]|uniref:Flagellar biosynthesis pathway, component FlhB n=1 Tax=Terriglobus roseus (strain DSM 18391 / NRRL B-41598 / KBS 63) TaxID=926566 RepID=I3ZFW5_TERRK|nr:EscU/YscU/HrcU family type III secretion system export apparatus switch protein [Terriglobus roseus]AFL88133.1 flagellar biosynthesis pathway, component FlhB [Terriglobus roseus DSM 18391]